MIDQLGAALLLTIGEAAIARSYPSPLSTWISSLSSRSSLFSRATSSFGSTSSLISIRFETIATRCEKRQVDIDSSSCASSGDIVATITCAHTGEWG